MQENFETRAESWRVGGDHRKTRMTRKPNTSFRVIDDATGVTRTTIFIRRYAKSHVVYLLLELGRTDKRRTKCRFPASAATDWSPVWPVANHRNSCDIAACPKPLRCRILILYPCIWSYGIQTMALVQHDNINNDVKE